MLGLDGHGKEFDFYCKLNGKLLEVLNREVLWSDSKTNLAAFGGIEELQE